VVQFEFLLQKWNIQGGPCISRVGWFWA